MYPSEGVRDNCTKLKIARRIELSPQSEGLVSCKATNSAKYFSMPHAVAQPANGSWWYPDDGLVLGSSLIAPDLETHYLLMMNLNLMQLVRCMRGTNQGGVPCHLYKICPRNAPVRLSCPTGTLTWIMGNTDIGIWKKIQHHDEIWMHAWIQKSYRSICNCSWSGSQKTTPTQV